MPAKWWTVYAVLSWLAVSSAFSADDGDAADVAKLRSKVAELQAENKMLNARVKQAERARLNAQFRLLSYLEHHLDADPINRLKSQEAMSLAVRLAPSHRGNMLIWRVLLKTGVLKDRMSLSDAQELLGPPTKTADTYVEWYFNPQHRRASPYLRARVAEQGLADWTVGRR